MKLTTKGRYAVTALLELAMSDDASPLSLAVIAQRQKLSLSYLESLFSQLRSHGIVKSHRGPGGGYVLALPAQQISIAQVVGIVDKPKVRHLARSTDVLLSDVDAFDSFLEVYLWDELNEKMAEFLSHISLSDLMTKKRLVEKVQTRTYNAMTPMGRAMHMVA